MYVYIQSEPGLWTVGFYDPKGVWHPDSDHTDREKAADRVAYLNGSVKIIKTEDAIKLWLLHSKEESDAYDVVNGVVVRAATELQARKIAAFAHGDEGGDVWLKHRKSTCIELLAGGDAGIVLCNYRAG